MVYRWFYGVFANSVNDYMIGWITFWRAVLCWFNLMVTPHYYRFTYQYFRLTLFDLINNIED
jgi:hypothetical protein